MLASFRSDFYLMRGYFKTILGLFFFMMVMSFVQQSNYFVFFYPAFMAVYLPISLFSLSEQSGWEAMLLSSPVTRSGIVRGRYLMCAATDLGFLLIGTVVSFLISRGSFAETAYPLLVSLCIVLLLNAVLLPVVYRFGPNKARFVIMGVCLVPALVLPLLLDVVSADQALYAAAEALTSIPILLLACLTGILLFLLSYLLSCRIYGKKEF